jgi:hypothetical protein
LWSRVPLFCAERIRWPVFCQYRQSELWSSFVGEVRIPFAKLQKARLGIATYPPPVIVVG